MSLSVKSVPREHALTAWQELESLIKRAVAVLGNEDVLDVLGHILTGHYQCIVAVDGDLIKAACITQFTNNRAGKVCTIVYIAGEGLTEWVNFVDIILDWCKAQGCIRVEGIGRRGWERTLSNKGFRLIATNIRKDL